MSIISLISNIREMFPLMLKSIVKSKNNCSPRLKAVEKLDMDFAFQNHMKDTIIAFFFMMLKRDDKSFYDFTHELGLKINQIQEFDLPDTDEITEQDILDIILNLLETSNVIVRQNPASPDDDDQSKQILDLQKELDKLREENKKLKKPVDESGTKNPLLEKELKKLKEENEELQKLKDESDAKIPLLEGELKKLKEENEELQKFKDDCDAKVPLLEEEIGKLNKENGRINQQNMLLQQSQEDNKKLITSLNDKIKDKESQITSLEGIHSKTLEEYRKKFEEDCKNEKVAAQKKYNDDIAKFMDDINSKYAQLENANQKNIDDLNKNCKDLKDKNTKLKKQVDKLTQKLAEQTENFNQKNDELIAIRKEKLNLADNKRYLIRKYNELGANYNDIKSRLSYLLEDRKSLLEKNEELKNQIKDHEALEQLPSESSIKIYDDYCTEKRLNELEEQVNEILKNEPGKGHNETINIITAEMKMILQQFHSLLVKYNKSVPKKLDEFYEQFLPKDADSKRELLEKYVNNCKP